MASGSVSTEQTATSRSSQRPDKPQVASDLDEPENRGDSGVVALANRRFVRRYRTSPTSRAGVPGIGLLWGLTPPTTPVTVTIGDVTVVSDQNGLSYAVAPADAPSFTITTSTGTTSYDMAAPAVSTTVAVTTTRPSGSKALLRPDCRSARRSGGFDDSSVALLSGLG